MESGPPALAGRFTLPPEHNPQSVGTIHGMSQTHELNDLTSHNNVQTPILQQRGRLQLAATVHDRQDAHRLNSQMMHSNGPISIPQGENEPNQNSTRNENIDNIIQMAPLQLTSAQKKNHSNQNERTKSQKTIKSTTKIASLNMRGYGNNNQDYSQNKWNHVNQIM